MASETQLKAAAQEMITVLTLRDDDKQPIVLTKGMKSEDYEELIKSAMVLIEPEDVFTTPTKRIVNSFDITYFPEVMKIEETDDTDIPPLPTLEQEIGSAEKLKQLKDIVLSEPQFKAIRGKVASFTTVDALREEMLWLLSDKKIPMKEQVLPMEETQQQVAEKIHKKNIKDKPVQALPDEVPLPVRENQTGFSMRVKDIISIKPFNNLFAIDTVVLDAVTESMKKTGYDNAFPVVVWEDVCIDGHTRLIAAEKVGIEKVPVLLKNFQNEQVALEYAVHNQRDRRNLSEAELLHCIQIIDKPLTKSEAGKKKGKSLDEKKEKITPTHKTTAKVLKIGESKVVDARTVLGDESALNDVESGKKTISQAAKEVRSKKKAEKPAKLTALPQKTRIECAVGLIKKSEEFEFDISELIKQTKNEYITFGGKNGNGCSEAVDTVIEVLCAWGIVKMIDDNNFEIVE